MQEPEITLAEAEARIAWVIAHPHMSEWLKQALRSADGLEPIALRNDLEILGLLLLPRAQTQLEIALAAASLGHKH